MCAAGELDVRQERVRRRMSFDIFYHTCNLGDRTVQRKNPLTGAFQTVPVDDGLIPNPIDP
jgi:hypothetical protein